MNSFDPVGFRERERGQEKEKDKEKKSFERVVEEINEGEWTNEWIPENRIISIIYRYF